VRKLIHTGCPEIEESIKWGHAFFLYRGQILCNLAAFKEHAGFGFWHQGMRKLLAAKFGRTDEAMGLMGRITSLDDLPDDRTLLRLIRTAVSLYDSGQPARAKSKPRPAPKNPVDLAAALKKNKKAAATWSNFSPSHRREYVEWLTEAKRDETRATRLATTLEWLAEGKPRNWKYLNC